MKTLTVALVAMLSVALSGCATIMEGHTQDIYVNVTPDTADCVAYRDGHPIGQYGKTTHILTISKSRNDMVVKCTAPGYYDKSVTFESSASAWGVVGALTLDLGIIDYSTGALNKYDATITIVMDRINSPTAAYSSANRSYPTAKPSFGITGSTVTSESSVSVGMSDAFGVWISSVAPSSPAERAGFKQGDVIQTVDDQRISTFDELSEDVSKAAPGSTMKFGVWRDRQTAIITVVFPGQI
jgi:uncharacterized protein YceK